MTDKKHTNIAQALAAAQMEMGKALKDSTNPHFKSKYADLGNVMDACMPALNKHGIAVIQPMVESEFGRAVITRFIHESGETLECGIPLIVGKNDMQGLGSALTYARRYGLMALAGIAPEDDDGNAAANSVQIGVKPKGKTWAQTVLQDLPETATKREKAEALTDALCAQWKRKKTKGELENEFERQKALIGHIKQDFPELAAQIETAYEQQEIEVSEPDAAELMGA